MFGLAWIPTLVVLWLSASPAAAAMRVATGSYVGNSLPLRAITGLEFQPDVVLVKGDLDKCSVVRTATMPALQSKLLGKSDPIGPDMILSLDSAGFTVGSNDVVNKSGVTYYWVAFQASPGLMAVGTYPGDDVDNRSVTGLGFQPSYVIVMSEANEDAMQRFADEVGDKSLPFQASDEKTDRIQALEPDGFQVGKHHTVNEPGKQFHYVAWAESPSRSLTGSYLGNGVDNRNVTGVGFEPDYMIVARMENGEDTVQRFASVSGDGTLPVVDDSRFPNGIQAFLSTGFQVGNDKTVNEAGKTIYWFALRDVSIVDLEVAKQVDNVTPDVGDTLTYSIRVANLGPGDATAVILSESLPAGLTFISAAAGQGAFSADSSSWAVGTVAVGDTARLALRVRVDPGTAGSVITNTAALVHVDQTDTLPDNDLAAVSVAVRGADLTLSKGVSPAKPNEGDPILYTVAVRNLGPDAATGIVVTDLLPAGVTYTGHTAGAGTYSDVTGLWTVGSLAAGQSRVLSIDATVDAGTGGATIVNRAFVSASDIADPDATNNEASASFGAFSADLNLTKDVDVIAPSEGDTLLYTIVVSNAGPDTATSVVADDHLPAGLVYVTDDVSQGSYSTQTNLWTVGTVPPGQSATLHITARVDEGTTGMTILNSAAIVAATQADPNNEDNADKVGVTVRGVDISVVKSVSDSSPLEGDTIIYRIRVRNAGPDAATAVSILDALPPGVSFVADSLGQGDYDPVTGRWNVGPLSPGSATVLAINASVDPGTAGNSIDNSAALEGADPTDINSSNDISSATIRVRDVDLALAKSAGALRVDEGDALVYTVELINNGPDGADSVAVAEPIPAGTTFASAVPSRGAYDPVTGIWSVGSVADGAAVTLTLTVSVNAGTGGTVLTNTASLLACVPEDRETSNNSAAVSTHVRTADLALAKMVSDPAPQEADTTIFTITLTNAGPDTATGVAVLDMLPSGLTYSSNSPSRGTYSPTSGVWTVGTMAPDSAATLTLAATVNAGTGGSAITNTASVAAGDQTDAVPGNNSASATLHVAEREKAVDLTLSKQVDNAAPDVGATVTYTIQLINAGPDTATGVAVSDVLPSGLTYSSSSPSRGTYSPTSGVWTVGTIAPDGAATLTLAGTVNTGTGGSAITNTASVTASDQNDVVPGNNTATATLTVTVPRADLTLIKTVSRTTASLGDTLTYAVTLGNGGPSTATGIRVTDPLPAGATLIDASPSRGSFAPTGLWDVGTLAPTESASLTVRVRINPDFAGVLIRNIAAVAAVDQADPHPGAEADTVSTLLPSADLAVRVSVSDAEPVEGDTFTCTVAASNAGPNAAAGVEIAVQLPTGVVLASAVPGQGTYNASAGRWIAGTLTVGAEAALVLSVTPSAGTAGDALVFTAEVAATDRDDPDSENNRATASVIPQHPLLVSVDAQSGTSLLPGDSPKEVFHMKLINRSAAVATLTALTLTNAATGSGTPGQLDRDWSALTLAAQGSASVPSATFSSGAATFGGLAVTVPARGEANLSIQGGASLNARDGDVLDLKVTAPGSLQFTGGAQVSGSWPLNPPGAFVVDGMAAAQIAHEDIASETILLGEKRRLALDVTIPANGYEADIWRGLALVNLGDADAETDIRSIEVWRDGGNGRFDGGLPDDVSMGRAQWRDDRWVLENFWRALPTTGLRIFATVDVDTLATPDRTIRLGIPLNGITVESNDDGPINRGVANGGTLVIAASPSEVVIASAEPQTAASLLPGGAPETLFRLHLYNNSNTAQVLTRLSLRSVVTGPGTSAQLDGNWSGLTLTEDLPAGTATNVPLAMAGVIAGSIQFSGFSVPIPAGNEVTLVVGGGASLLARDGDRLDLLIAGAESFGFTGDVPALATWPLDPPGSFVVDGMAAAQISLNAVKPENLVAGSRRNLLFDAVLPANGYQPDHLARFNVINLGSAQPGVDISEVELWLDDGDGVFATAKDRVLGSLRYTGDRWEITGLAEPVPLAGLRIFVTADIAELATEGRTLRLQIPAFKDVGVGMASDNDGPRDRSVTNPEITAITTSDRITLVAGSLAGGTTFPGARNVPLLRLTATNTYDTAKAVSRLSFTNVSRRNGTSDPGMDNVVQTLELRSDANENGILDALSVDPVLGTAQFIANRADFDGLRWELPPGHTGHVFLTAAVSLTSASDGDVLGASIDGLRDVTFDDAVTVAAAWPIDSGGRWTVNGMVAAQISAFATPSVAFGPGEGPILAFDFVVPSNGDLADVLHGVRIQNQGTAVPTEINELRLWNDGGDGRLSTGGDDVDLGGLTWTGQGWSSPVLNKPIPAGGLRLFVSMRVSPSLSGAATVRLAVPVNGITVDSGNDGPVDTSVASGQTVILSAAPILSSLETVPRSVTVNQSFALKMALRNLSGETVANLTPSLLSATGEASPVLVSGPDRSGFSLSSSAVDTITWVYRATAPGTAEFTGFAGGTGASSGVTTSSFASASNTLRAYLGAGALELYPVGPRSMSVKRGQASLVPLTLTLLNPGSRDGSDIRLRRLRMRIENEAGAPLSPGTILDRLVISEGSRIYVSRSRSDLLSGGTELDLVFTPSVLVTTSEPTTLNLQLDVAEDTAVPAFRIAILDSTWFDAEDATGGAPVAVTLRNAIYPLRSGLARIGVEATSVRVRGVVSTEVRAGQGQNDVPLLGFTIENPGVDGLTMDARFGGMGLVVVDADGHVLTTPERVLDMLRVRSPLKLLGERRVSADANGVIRLTFSGFLALPVNSPVTLSVDGDIAASAEAAVYRLRLADPSVIDAWEPNSLETLPPTYETSPIEGAPLRVELPAEWLAASGDPGFPAAITVGSRGALALRGTLRHPGAAGTAAIRVDTLTVRCWDRERSPLAPGAYFERLRIYRGGIEAATVAIPPEWSGPVAIPVGAWMLESGASIEFDLVADVDPRAPTSLLELAVGSSDICAVDANTRRRISVQADQGAQLPLYSGLVRFESPPREILMSLTSLMPAALAPDGREIAAARLVFSNPAPEGSGPVRIDHLVVRAGGGEGQEMAIGLGVERVSLYRNGESWATSATLSPDSTTAWISFPEPIDVDSGAEATIEVRPVIRAGATFTSLRLGWGGADVGIVQPQGTLLTVAVRAREGGDFPLWTASGALGPGTLRESYANFPNPFAAGRERTAFVFYLPASARVTLKIWTVRAESVITLIEGERRPPGLFQEDFWDGRNGRGSTVVNGVYIAELVVHFDDGTSERLLRKVAVVR